MNAPNMCSSAIVGEVLKGQENYANWRACIQNYLWVRDLWDVVVDETLGPPKQEEISEEADLKAWGKRNVSALHAIQISCTPTMLSCIRDKTSAKDAWNTLAQMCQPPPVPAEHEVAVKQHDVEHEDVLHPAAEVVERTLTLDLLKSINKSDLVATKSLLTRHPHLVKGSVKPLRFAIMLGNLEMIDELLSYMSEEDVKMQDSYGRTALHYTAMTPGHTKIAERLIRKNKELLTIPEYRGYIPLVSSCASGHKVMTHYLYNMTTPAFLLSPQNQTHAALVVCFCVANDLLDVAVELLRRRPKLALARFRDEDWNAVRTLSYLPSSFLGGTELSFWQRRIYSCLKVQQSEALYSDDNVGIDTQEQQDKKETKNFMMQGNGKLLRLWSNLLKFFGIKQIYDIKMTHFHAHELLLLMSKTIDGLEAEQIPQSLVLDAVVNASQRGMTEFIVEIIKNNPDLLTFADNKGRNIFLIAVAYRQENVLNLIYGHGAIKYDFPNYLDEYNNNMLHLAGKLESESQLKLNQISGAALQMQRELHWFKEVECIVPPSAKTAINKEGETPYEIFDRSHAKLVKEGEQWIKGVAQSSTIVGSLIITIMFAALFTVPGGNDQQTGIPLLLTKKLFKVFIISDATSLFASTTSVLIFVGLLTSRYAKDDFLTSLPKKLIIGLLALFISIAAMMVAFCSTVFIMLKGQLEIVIPLILLAAIPICIFMWFQFPLLLMVFMSTYGPGIFDRKMKKWL